MAEEKSPYFDVVSANLELGGTVYAYVDLDGDAQRVANFLLTVARDAPQPSRDAEAPRSATGLVRALGLDRLHAVGVSSRKADPLYHNRAFALHTGPREGLLRLFGSDPVAPSLGKIAPPEADLVWEQQLDLDAIVEAARAFGDQQIGASPGDVDRFLSQSVNGLGVTVGELIDRLDTTLGLIIEVDEQRVLRLPGETLWFPYTDFLLQLDGLGSLADTLAERAAYDPFIVAEATEQWLTIRLGIRLPPPWHAYNPSLVKNRITGRIYLVSRPEYLTRCLMLESNVTETAAYQAAFAGLPPKSNGTLFLSPQFTREIHAMLDRIINEVGATPATAVARYLLPSAGTPTGWIVANRSDGTLFASNSSSSHKTTLITLGYAALLPALAAFGASRSATSTEPPMPFEP